MSARLFYDPTTNTMLTREERDARRTGERYKQRVFRDVMIYCDLAGKLVSKREWLARRGNQRPPRNHNLAMPNIAPPFQAHLSPVDKTAITTRAEKAEHCKKYELYEAGDHGLINDADDRQTAQAWESVQDMDMAADMKVACDKWEAGYVEPEPIGSENRLEYVGYTSDTNSADPEAYGAE